MSSWNPKDECPRLQYKARGRELSVSAMHELHNAAGTINYEAFMQMVCKVCVEKMEYVFNFGGYGSLQDRKHTTYHVSCYQGKVAAYFNDSGEEYVFLPTGVETPWNEESMDIEGLNVVKEENIVAIDGVINELDDLGENLMFIKDAMRSSIDKREKLPVTVKEDLSKARKHLNELKTKADVVMTQTTMTLESDRGTFSH